MKRAVRIAVTSAIAVASFILGVASAEWLKSSWYPGSYHESRARGDTIVLTLNKFRSENGRFPRSMAELFPTGVPKLVEPNTGNATWKYVPSDDGHGFALTFGANAFYYPCASYHSDTREWSIDE